MCQAENGAKEPGGGRRNRRWWWAEVLWEKQSQMYWLFLYSCFKGFYCPKSITAFISLNESKWQLKVLRMGGSGLESYTQISLLCLYVIGWFNKWTTNQNQPFLIKTSAGSVWAHWLCPRELCEFGDVAAFAVCSFVQSRILSLVHLLWVLCINVWLGFKLLT